MPPKFWYMFLKTTYTEEWVAHIEFFYIRHLYWFLVYINFGIFLFWLELIGTVIEYCLHFIFIISALFRNLTKLSCMLWHLKKSNKRLCFENFFTWKFSFTLIIKGNTANYFNLLRFNLFLWIFVLYPPRVFKAQREGGRAKIGERGLSSKMSNFDLFSFSG